MPLDVKRMLPRHFKILELSLGGMTSAAIARSLDITPSNVSQVISSQKYQDELARRRGERNLDLDTANTSSIVKAQEAAAELSMKAVKVHGALMDSDDDRIKLSAAKGILDRTFSPVGGGRDGGGGGNVTTVIAADNILILKTAIEESSPSGVPHSGVPLKEKAEVIDGHAAITG